MKLLWKLVVFMRSMNVCSFLFLVLSTFLSQGWTTCRQGPCQIQSRIWVPGSQHWSKSPSAPPWTTWTWTSWYLDVNIQDKIIVANAALFLKNFINSFLIVSWQKKTNCRMPGSWAKKLGSVRCQIQNRDDWAGSSNATTVLCYSSNW